MEPRRCLIPVLTLAFMIGPAPAQPAGPGVPFRLQDGYRIVVLGSVRGADGVRMMIDTGADCSVVDRDLVERLGLSTLAERVRFNAFGRIRSTCRAILPGLRIGPILTTLPCLVADIPYRGVDAVIGLDLLRRYPFTIDFEKRSLAFGLGNPPGETVSFDPASSLVIIPMNLGGDVIRVMIDTGANCLCLFRSRVRSWVLAGSVRSHMISTHLAGKSGAREACLPRILVGRAVWTGLRALIVDVTTAHDCDGALGITALGLRRVHFDFRSGVFGFDRAGSGTP